MLDSRPMDHRGLAAPGAAFAAGLIVASCIVQQPAPSQPTTLPQNEYQEGGEGQGAPAALVEGDYLCSFEQQGFQYPSFACRVYRDSDGRKVLDKLTGSQRIRGWISDRERGFDFAGQFYCPYGACDESVNGQFDSLDNGTHTGTLQTANGAIVVRMQFLPGGFAGLGYGGGVYGGSYGGTASP